MWYLFLQIWIWLIIAFALGWLSHWFMCCRGNQAGQDIATSAEQSEPEANRVEEPVADNNEPAETDDAGKD